LQGLQIGKSHFPEPVTAAWNFWFYIDVTNTCGTAATNVVISDTLPPEVAAYSVQPDLGGVFDGINTVTWTIPFLPGCSSIRVSVKARTVSTMAGRCMTNWASADSDQAAPAVHASDVACIVAGPLARPTATPTPAPSPTPLPGTVVRIGESEDTYNYRYTPNANYWLSSQLKVGYKQLFEALLRFDLSSIPPGATIDEARLELWALGWGAADITIGAYGISGTVTISETTWVDSQSGVPWALPGAGDVVLDRRPDPESVLTTAGILRWYSWDLSALVQQWVSGLFPNNGVLLRQDFYAPFSFIFASHESPVAELRPRLVIRYH